METIKNYENRDISEIFNMYVEKQFIFSNNNRIKASKLFEKYYQKHMDIRIKIGRKRMELYTTKMKGNDSE